MANSIEYAKKFVPVIDEIYKAGSITEGMDASVKLDYSEVNEVKILKVATSGLGDYSRENGYPTGDVTAAWETMKLEIERGKEISIDRMDNEEALGLVFGEVVGGFMREHVIPEIDAYRFAKYAGAAGTTKVSAALTADTVIAAFDEAVRVFDENEVGTESRLLCINSDIKPLVNNALSRKYGSDSAVNTVLRQYNDIPIVYVPKKRFMTKVTLNSGASSWGYTNPSDAEAINFMLLDRRAVQQAKKFILPKIFTPDENQDKDAWKFQFRLYHDCFIFENKAKGIYVHTKPNA